MDIAVTDTRSSADAEEPRRKYEKSHMKRLVIVKRLLRTLKVIAIR